MGFRNYEAELIFADFGNVLLFVGLNELESFFTIIYVWELLTILRLSHDAIHFILSVLYFPIYPVRDIAQTFSLS